jgi:hypothetical protein
MPDFDWRSPEAYNRAKTLNLPASPGNAFAVTRIIKVILTRSHMRRLIPF